MIALVAPCTARPLCRLRIAYRKFVLVVDREAWDFAVYIGQGFASPVHTDLILPDNRILTATTDEGITFVERNYDGESGWWEFEDVWVSVETGTDVIRWANEEVNAKLAHNAAHPDEPWGYDWDGVERFVMAWKEESPNNWFCSEVVSAALLRAGVIGNVLPWQVSPHTLRHLPKRSVAA